MTNPLLRGSAGATPQPSTTDAIADVIYRSRGIDFSPLRFFRGAGTASGIVGALEMIFAPTTLGDGSANYGDYFDPPSLQSSTVSDFLAPEAQFDGPASVSFDNVTVHRVAPFLNVMTTPDTAFDPVTNAGTLTIGSAANSVAYTPNGPITAISNQVLDYQVGAIGSLVGRTREALTEFRFSMQERQNQIQVRLNSMGGVDLSILGKINAISEDIQDFTFETGLFSHEAELQQAIWDEHVKDYLALVEQWQENAINLATEHLTELAKHERRVALEERRAALQAKITGNVQNAFDKVREWQDSRPQAPALPDLPAIPEIEVPAEPSIPDDVEWTPPVSRPNQPSTPVEENPPHNPPVTAPETPSIPTPANPPANPTRPANPSRPAEDANVRNRQDTNRRRDAQRRFKNRSNKKHRMDRKFRGRGPAIMKLIGPALSALETGGDLVAIVSIFAAAFKNEHSISALDVLHYSARDADDPREFVQLLLKRADALGPTEFDFNGFIGALATHFAFETVGRFAGTNARLFLPEEGFVWTRDAPIWEDFFSA